MSKSGVSENGVSKPARGKAGKAGLILNPSRVDKRLRVQSGVKRVGGVTSIFVTAGVEHVLIEILKASVAEAEANKKKGIAAEHVVAAVRSHSDLWRALDGMVFTSQDELPKATPYVTSTFDKERAKKRKEVAAA
jgi:hypothetical protein